MILITLHAQKRHFICDFFPERKNGIILIGAEKRRALKRFAKKKPRHKHLTLQRGLFVIHNKESIANLKPFEHNWTNELKVIFPYLRQLV